MAIEDPNFAWLPVENIHHLQWPKAWYPNETDNLWDPTNPAAFYNLPVNKVWLPMNMHDLLHKFMLPPPLPTREVMYYRTEAWQVARSLFHKARPLVFLPRQLQAEQEMLKIDNEAIERPLKDESIIKAIDTYMALREQLQARLERIPTEFQIVRPDQHDPAEVARVAGKVVVPKAQPYSLTVGSPLAA